MDPSAPEAPGPRDALADRVRVRLFGPLTCTVDGAVLDLGPPKQRAVLGALALEVSSVVSGARLVDLLWGDRSPRTAEHSVQLYVSHLRRAFVAASGSPLIVTRRPGYVLDLPDEVVDVVEFERQARAGRDAAAAGDPAAAALLDGALDLWTGDPLDDPAFDRIGPDRVRRLGAQRLEALDDLAGWLLDAGQPDRAVTRAEQACLLDPFRERSRELLMHALYRAGRHPEALRTYTAYRESLREELGLDPAPSLARLQEQILVHDPTLAAGDRTGRAVRNPYKGLRPFRADDAPDFFGREQLTQLVLDRVVATRTGEAAPLVAVVGPSGAGKSSVLAAGVVPRLDPSDWHVVEVPAHVHGLTAVVVPAPSAHAWAVVVLDQFEEHLLALDDVGRRAFLDQVVALVGRERTTVLLALRADLYDRPLQHPGLAGPFAAGVVNVLPMTAAEVESAVVRPATRVGARVEPALVAELVARTADQPAQLPLLQYVLTELFDRAPDTLTQSGYDALGGLHGALSRRADEIRGGWTAAEESAATQVFLRLVTVAEEQVVPRRAPVSELSELVGVDPVAVSDVLTTLVRHYLVTLDRDPATGSATVEPAHQALFARWPWLATLIDQHRAALDRLAALRVARAEWEAAARHPDFLMRGSRLEQFQRWRVDGLLRLTDGEAAYVRASQRAADAEAAHARAADEQRTRLERRARRGLLLAAAALVLGVAGVVAVRAAIDPPPSVGWIDQQDGYLDGLREAGLSRAAAEHRLTIVTADDIQQPAGSAIEQLAQDNDLVIVSTNDVDLEPIAREHPDVRFLYLAGTADAPNITSVAFANQQGAFLAGAAAALASRTHVLGYIGGVDTNELLGFQAGFEAGARAVDPDVRVLSAYLSRLPAYDGFDDMAGARRTTTRMVADGADVVFPVAAKSQFGTLGVVEELSAQTGRQIWMIGVDDDIYLDTPSHQTATTRDHVLTSVVKRFDLTVYDGVRAFLDGDLEPGLRSYDLADDGITLSREGDGLTPYWPRLDALREQIVSGEVVVPCVPEGTDPATAAAIELGPHCPSPR